MEEYVNENTIIKNEIYDLFKDTIICPLCSHIMIEPVICLNCQNTFCKKCYEKNGSCSNKCNNSQVKDVIGKNKYITKFKFRCIKGCGEEIPFDNIKDHYSSNCKRKPRTLTPKEAAAYTQKTKKKLPHLASKYNNNSFN